MHFEQGYFELQDMAHVCQTACKQQSISTRHIRRVLVNILPACSQLHQSKQKAINIPKFARLFPFEHTHQTRDVDNHVGYSFVVCYHSYRCATLNT